MQRKNWIFLASIATFLMAGIFALHSTSAKVENPACCQKGPSACPETKKPSSEMPPESFSVN
jgi:hypothetical protein